MNSVKALAESPDLKTIPSIYTYSVNSTEPAAADPQDAIPTIDFSSLTSADPNLRSQMVRELDIACKHWGFFRVINHGVPESLMRMIIEKSKEFFDMTDEEKKEYEEKGVLDPIRYGTSFNSKKDDIFYWRDFLKVIIHPEFHCPNKPLGFREVLYEYSKRTREVVKGLLSGISTSLGLDQSYVDKALKLESGLQVFVINLYPPCPQPELAIGMPPHSDHGLLTLLINNGVGGLQIKHKGKWVNVNNDLPNSFLVNTGDQLQVFSNGMYKSVEHRAIVNNVVTRLSVVVANGPSLDAVVEPAYKLVMEEGCTPEYIPMKYKEYLEMQQNNQIVGKTCLEMLRSSKEHQRTIIESLISKIPSQNDNVSCSFLLWLLRVANTVCVSPALVIELKKRAGMQLEKATLVDLLIPCYNKSDMMYDRCRSLLTAFGAFSDSKTGGEIEPLKELDSC